MDNGTNLSPSPAREFVEILWGHLTGALEDAHVTVCAQDFAAEGTKRGSFYGVAQAPISTLDAVAALIESTATTLRSTYVGVNPMRVVPRAQTAAGFEYQPRGQRDDVVAGTALFADIDVAEHAHAKDDLPTRSTAQEWIDELGRYLDLLVVDTGGGLHAYAVLGEPLPLPEWDRLAALWKHFWARRAATAGHGFDVGVLADAARVLRPAGTWNPGQAGTPEVRIVRRPVWPAWPVAAIEEMLVRAIDALPEMPADAPAITPAGAQARRAPVDPAKMRAGDRFSLAVPVHEFLAVTLRAREARQGGGMVTPRPDGSYSEDASIKFRSWGKDQPITATAFGNRVQRDWGLRDHMHNLTSFDLLVRLWLSGDYRIGAKLIRGLRGDYRAVLEVCQAVPPHSGIDADTIVYNVLTRAATRVKEAA